MGKKTADTSVAEQVEPTAMNDEMDREGGEVYPELVDRLLEQAGERELLGEGGLLQQLNQAGAGNGVFLKWVRPRW